MDKQQSNQHVDTTAQDLFQSISQFRSEITRDQVSLPDKSPLEKILEQRHDQRSILFNFAISMSRASFIFLFGIVITNIWAKLFINSNLDLVNSNTLQIIAVSVFVQILGIVALIAKAIWDDRNYRSVLFHDHQRKHQ